MDTGFYYRIDWKKIASSVFKAFGAALGGIGAFLVGLFEDAWTEVTTYLSGWMEGYEKLGLDAAAGLLAGILAGIGEIGAWIVENIFTPFIQGIASAFGIHSQPTVMAQYGKYIVEGLLNGISETWVSVQTFISEALSSMEGLFELSFNAVDKLTGGKLSAIRDTIEQNIGSAKETVRLALEKMKGFFDFEWSLPHIKLPRFSVSGGKAPWGFMGMGSLPKVSVSWYDKATRYPVLLNNATIFGATGNKLLGGGETEQEVVAGTRVLMDMIQDAVTSANSRLRGAMAGVNVSIFIENFENYSDSDIEDLTDKVAERIQFEIDKESNGL